MPIPTWMVLCLNMTTSSQKIEKTAQKTKLPSQPLAFRKMVFHLTIAERWWSSILLMEKPPFETNSHRPWKSMVGSDDNFSFWGPKLSRFSGAKCRQTVSSHTLRRAMLPHEFMDLLNLENHDLQVPIFRWINLLVGWQPCGVLMICCVWFFVLVWVS